MTTIGEKLSPILVEIENTLWEHEFRSDINTKPNYPNLVKIYTNIDTVDLYK